MYMYNQNGFHFTSVYTRCGSLVAMANEGLGWDPSVRYTYIVKLPWMCIIKYLRPVRIRQKGSSKFVKENDKF